LAGDLQGEDDQTGGSKMVAELRQLPHSKLPLRVSVRVACVFVALLVSIGNRARAIDRPEPSSGYLSKNFTAEDGLLSNDVNVILQTRDGFLWIGTAEGLLRFDGRHFTPIKFLPQDSPIVVRALAEAPDGALWVGTPGGLARIPSGGSSELGHTVSSLYHPGSGDGDSVQCLHFSRNGDLWVGTLTGLYRFEQGRFSTIIPELWTSRIEEASNGNLLVITSKGFVEWDGKQIIRHPDLPARLGVVQHGIFQVIEDHAGTIWYGTKAGVARERGGSIEQLKPYAGDGDPNVVFRLYEDPQGNVWFTQSGDLYQATAAGRRLIAPNVNAQYLASDRDGDLWVGTRTRGLFRLKSQAVKMFTTADGLPPGKPMAVLAASDGNLWVANYCGGLSRFDGRRFQTYVDKDGLYACVFSLAEDRNHDILVGIHGGGVARFQNGHFTQISAPDRLTNRVVTAIVPAKNGPLWIAYSDGGLDRVANGQVRRFTTADGLSSDSLLSAYEDRRGVLWVETTKGIDRLKNDRFEAVLTADSFTTEAGRFGFGEDRFGHLFAFGPAAASFHIQENRVVRLNGAPRITGMAQSRENLWLCGDGIYRAMPDSLQKWEDERDAPPEYTLFNRADGMNSTQCSGGFRNMAVTNDGRLWVATEQGIAMLEFSRLRHTERKPAIFIERIVSGKTVQAPGRDLVLPAGTNHVELHFDTIELASPEAIRLQYRLDGVDREWLDAGSSFAAVYSGIPVGTHPFHVRACNSDGVWDQAGIAYNVTQQPYFYETAWFRLSALAVFGLLVAGIYRWRIRQLKIQEKLLRDVVETIPAMTFTTLSGGSCTFVNKRWTEYTGLSVEQSSGTGWQSAVHAEDLARYSENWCTSVATGQIFEDEARFRRAGDGEYRHFLVRGVPLRDQHANIVRWYGTLTDIEDRKRAEQEREKLRELEEDLAHVNRVSTLGEMAASLAHEIKQPIAAAITSANSCIEWLAHEPPNLDRARAAATKIDKYGNRAAEIIDRIRSFYKKSPPERELVDVNGIIQEMLTLLKDEATGYSIAMRTELAASLPKIRADRVQLQQVFMNLMLNGIEAMKDSGGELTVKSERQDGQLQFSVSDTGVGLPVEKMDQIFSAFFTTKPQGSGMGLAISRSIVESHGGRLWATANDGRGATFHFTLPTAAEILQVPATGT
jgi:PAS domain S-box-containing protein